MRVLVTGSSGLVGRAVIAALTSLGHDVVAFDRQENFDILDVPQLRKAASGCDTVIHSAALLGREGESTERIFQANVQGTWNVLEAACTAKISRVVFLSSVDALGVFKGERAPDYLPIDDTHPCYPSTPYGISKRIAEEMCRYISAARHVDIACLRPPGVWAPETYDVIQALRAERASYEWDPFWEYGAFIDARDLANACVGAITTDFQGYHCVAVASSDITTSGKSSRELASFVHPNVEWRGSSDFEEQPYRSLLDVSRAQELLEWQPRYTWQAFINNP